MSGCCNTDDKPFDGATPAYRRILRWVIAINAAAFVLLAVGGLAHGSAALSANAMDFLADAATYGISLWAIGKAAKVRAGAALLKGASLTAMGAAIISFAVWRAFSGAPPEGVVISGLALAGLAANLVAGILLFRYRNGDANVRSVWLCTRNDVVESAAVAVAGGLVWLTGSRWPDLIGGGILGAIFLHSAWSIVRQALEERRCAEPLPTPPNAA